MKSELSTASTELSFGPTHTPEAQTALSPSAFQIRRSAGRVLAGVFLGAALAAPSASGVSEAAWWSLRESGTIEGSTVEEEIDPALTRQVRELFDSAASEFFQDGIRSRFSNRLLMLINRRGAMAFRAIARYLFSGNGKPHVVSEGLRWIADTGEPSTLAQRWTILERSLSDPSPQVRDGAILGFAALDDPRAEGLLTSARNLERFEELRTLIDQVISQLRRVR